MVGSLIMPDYRFTTSHLLTSMLKQPLLINNVDGFATINVNTTTTTPRHLSLVIPHTLLQLVSLQMHRGTCHFRLRFFLSFLVIQRFNKGAILEAHCSANGRGKWLKWKCNVPLGRNASPLLQYDNVIIVQLLSDIETSFLKIHLHDSRIYFFILRFIFFFIPSSFMLK